MATPDKIGGIRRLISPAVALAAAERGITPAELSTIPGSGAGGRLVVVDLQAAGRTELRDLGSGSEVPRLSRSAGTGQHRGVVTVEEPSRNSIVVPMDDAQRHRSRTAIEDMQASAQLTSAVEVDVTDLLQRVQMAQDMPPGAWPVDGDARALLLPQLIAAVASTLADHPAINARIDADAGTVTYRERLNLEVIASGPKGDVAALILDAATLTIEQIRVELSTIRLLAMAGLQSLRPSAEATFTLYDRLGARILFETPPLPRGTAASLALGWVERRPIVTPEGESQIVWAGYLCLTYDHRLIDGSDAARFLSDLASAFAHFSWTDRTNESALSCGERITSVSTEALSHPQRRAVHL